MCHTHIHTCMHTHTHTHTHARTHTHTHAHIHTHAHAHTHACTHAHTHMHACTHTHMHTSTHTHTHTHAHTHRHSKSSSQVTPRHSKDWQSWNKRSKTLPPSSQYQDLTTTEFPWQLLHSNHCPIMMYQSYILPVHWTHLIKIVWNYDFCCHGNNFILHIIMRDMYHSNINLNHLVHGLYYCK